MAKSSAVEKNQKRIRMALENGGEARRTELREAAKQARKEGKPVEEIFEIYQQLNKMPRDTSRIRIRNRCRVTGRPHGYYGRLQMSRIALRQLGSAGEIPGLVKSSW
tara:strand:- start:660 stop:980 length:321 start_codon:yes stop_codon:yes gene_type:complete